jgi:formylglycine-generating enzyme required for sulfatase activity
VSSITQAKAEAQKLIKRYNQLQAEAKKAVPAEAARKAAEADKLVSQISALQLAITKLQAKDHTTATKKTVATPKKQATDSATSTASDIEPVAGEKMVPEDRISRLEEAQKKTRTQIEQLTRAKRDLTRLKNEAEKSAASVAQGHRASDEKLQQELAKLIKKKEAEHEVLKQELDAVRQQAQKDAELLKVQRDAARAMMEKQKQLEKEQSLASHQNRGKKGWLVVSVVAIFALTIGVLLTLLFTPNLRISGSSPTPAPAPKIPPKPPQPPVDPPKKRPVKGPMETYQDRLKGGPSPWMVRLPGGTFKMGSKGSLPYPDERPQHKVTLKSFSIGKYEVTFEEYDWFAWATGRNLPEDKGWGRGKRPVINVSWEAAVEYTKWLSNQTGYQYRLPSEREWEYAAKAGTETFYWWGYKVGENNANCGICKSKGDGRKTATVGSFPGNAFTLHDTIGNVMEWTFSCFHSSYRGAPATGYIWEGGDCSKRVVRSSSFRSYENNLRTTKRHKYSPKTRMDTLGFRVVRVNEK